MATSSYRNVFFAHNGPGPYPCHFCRKDVLMDVVHVHHLDSDPTNNLPENLAPTHRGCHTQHHSKGKEPGKRRSSATDGGMSISTICAFFFDQTPTWLRYHERLGRLEDENGTIGRRLGGHPSGDRRYTLADVRKIAYALHHYGIISAEGYKNCIARIATMEKPVFSRSKR